MPFLQVQQLCKTFPGPGGGTTVFDHPTPTSLATFMRREVAPDSSNGDGGALELMSLLAELEKSSTGVDLDTFTPRR